MLRRLGIAALVVLTAFAAAPAFSQEKSKKSPGTMATIDRAANQNRAICAREAKAQKLHFFKRRHFMKACMKH